MPFNTDMINANRGSVTVGSTGTIGSLMTRELESMKHSPRISTSIHKKHQTSPVSVPCGASPGKSIHRRSPPREFQSCKNISSSSSRSNGSNPRRNPAAARKPSYTAVRGNGYRAPMLGSQENPSDRILNTNKLEKKCHTYLVEAVDVKCGNPMSSRLRKLGFSKLSESFS